MAVPTRACMLSLLMASVALAGCSDGATDDGSDGGNTPAILVAGKGAIAGLLVDDRFRPLQLTDNPTSEFQTEGFVLLQETGQQVQTNPDGEFTFVDLDPGEYTLRVQAEGHEATPERVTVEAGLFAESTVIARRVADIGGTILTQAYTMFIPCAVQIMAETIAGDCTGDQSGDSSRSRYYSNLTHIDGITAVVTEMLANQVGNYGIQIGWGEAETLNYGYYAIRDFYSTDYGRIVMHYNETQESDIGFFGVGVPMSPFLNDRIFHTSLFLYGEGAEEGRGAAPGTYPFTGVGADLGVKARFIESAFLGEPEVDVDTYCLLCP